MPPTVAAFTLGGTDGSFPDMWNSQVAMSLRFAPSPGQNLLGLQAVTIPAPSRYLTAAAYGAPAGTSVYVVAANAAAGATTAAVTTTGSARRIQRPTMMTRLRLYFVCQEDHPE